MKKRLLSILFALSAIALQAQTIYVRSGATGTGSSWGNACDLETAVSNAAAGSEIWIEKGTYYPSKMLEVSNFTKLYGGFSGTETSLSERDVASNPTIIDAQQKFGSVIYLGTYAELNGLIIQNGNASNSPGRNGGGVYAEDNTVIEDCQIINNYAFANGGGIYAHENLTLLNSTVENNTAGNSGNNVFGCCVVVEGSSDLAPFVCNTISTMDYTYTSGTSGVGFGPLTVSAIGTDVLSYQWYSNTTKSTIGGTPVGTNSPSYTPSPFAAGKLYYYVVVTNAYGKDTSNVSGLYTVNPLNFDYNGATREVTLSPGTYKIECWGAQGGERVVNKSVDYIGARGGYSKGVLTLTARTVLYCYVGGKGARGSGATGGAGGWNGGGKGGNDGGSNNDDVGGGGGGASDVRVISGSWNNATSLRSRIIVAGGGGGSREQGAGGGLNGSIFSSATGARATQTGGYSFGTGQAGGAQTVTGYVGNGGGGGGWYGGGADVNRNSDAHSGLGGNGGSGFISGHSGCNAVNESGAHTGSPTHYSGLVFTETVMIGGTTSMPNPRGSGNITGNTGNGYVRITRIK